MLLFINILIRYKPNLDITLSIFPTKKTPCGNRALENRDKEIY